MKCHFNLVSDEGELLDNEGIEIRDLAQAQAQAERAIEELRDSEEDASGWESWSLEATDADGTVLFSIGLRKVLH
jgi:hypothetical protein